MAHKNHYDVLDCSPTAPAEEIRRAFRFQIARYHPDKVQHLGKEFQDMAAGRAAELTEAYRVLSNEAQRAEYDRTLAMGGGPTAVPPEQAPSPPPAESPVQAQAAAAQRMRAGYTPERASRDQIVRKATVEKIRQALVHAGGEYNETQARGFDIAMMPKPKLFGGGKRPGLLGRFIDTVDRAAVAEAWPLAVKWFPSVKSEVCVFLLGTMVAPPRELAEAIAEQRRKICTAKVTMIPVDVRTWDAHVPVDTPAVCKDLLAWLRRGT